MAFERATAVKQIDSHTYSADFHDDWCIGSVPHGGYVTSTIQNAVKKHFDTTLRKQDQPHTLALHLDFLRRTDVGHAEFKIKDVKLGRQMSVVHVSLSQDGREEVVGYCTHAHLEKEVGPTFHTNWQAHPKRIPLSSNNLIDLEAGRDPAWTELKNWPHSTFRKATQQIRAWFPRDGQVAQNIYDMWVALQDPTETWTNNKLGYLVDMFPQVCESYILHGFDQYDPKLAESQAGLDLRDSKKKDVTFWYPTVLLNLDVKKALPEGGAKFLFMRLQTKQIQNGRYDLELVVWDEHDEIVALSHHVCLLVSAERNSKGRTKQEGKSQSKI